MPWGRVEAPPGAPPIAALMVRAITCRAVKKGELAFASPVALGFHALLPTCEILSLRFVIWKIYRIRRVVSLQASKSGLRTGTPPITGCIVGLPKTFSRAETPEP